MKRKKPLKSFLAIFFVLACLSAGVFLFRVPLAMKGLGIMISHSLPSGSDYDVAYDTAQFEQGNFKISGLHYSSKGCDVTIDETYITPKMEWKKFRFTPALKFVHPTVTLEKERAELSAGLIAPFLPQKRLAINGEVESGVLQVGLSRFYFRLEKNNVLSMAHDPALLDDPFVQVSWEKQEKGTNVHLETKPLTLGLASHFFAFLLPEWGRHFQISKGTAKLSLDALVGAKQNVIDFAATYQLDGPEVTRGSLNLSASKLEGAMTKAEGNRFQLTEGALDFGNFIHLKDVTASYDQKDKGELLVQGELENLGTLSFHGEKTKGALHFATPKNEEAVLNTEWFSQAEGPSLLRLSMSQWGGKALESIKHYLALSLPFFDDLSLATGELDAHVALVFDKAHFKEVSIEEAKGQNFTVKFGEKIYPVESVTGEGKWLIGGPYTCSFDAQFPINFDNESKPAQLSASVESKQSTTHFTGSLSVNSLEKESIQFGVEMRRLLPRRIEEVFEGWVRAEHLSPSVYQPISNRLFPEIKVEGILDICGTFNGEQVELSMQCDDFEASKKGMTLKARRIGQKDPMLLKTEGRAEIVYDMKHKSWLGHIPLEDATLFDKQSQLSVEKISGNLDILPEQTRLTMHGATAAINKTKLLSEITAELSDKNQTLEVKGLRARWLVPFDEQVYLMSPALVRKGDELFGQIECRNSKNKPLASLSLQGDKKISLTLHAALPLAGKWEGSQDRGGSYSFTASALTFGGKDLGKGELKFRKQPGKFLVEQCKWSGGSLKGILEHGDEQLKFHDVEMYLGGLFLGTRGTAQIDWPTKKETFAIRGEAEIDGEIHSPVPMQMQSKTPFRFAFSPATGLIFSQGDFQMGSSSFKVDQVEIYPPKKKIHMHGCQYALKRAALASFFEQDGAPGVIQAIKWPENLEGTANITIDQEGTKIDAVEGDAHVHLVVKKAVQERGGSWELDIKEPLQKKPLAVKGIILPSGRYTLEKIKGEYKDQRFDLKGAQEGKALVGSAKVDFPVLSKWITLPDFLETAKLGKGYRLDGELSIGLKNQWSFRGKWRGDDFDFLGWQMHFLETKVQMHPDEVTFENCLLTDDAGRISCPKVALFKDSKKENWHFEIPEAEVKNFQPSFLRKVRGPDAPLSSLVIKGGVIKGLRGSLGQPQSYVGKAAFRYAGLKLPKVDGKDLPSSGELECELTDEKFYITALKGIGPITLDPGAYFTTDGQFHIDLVSAQTNAFLGRLRGGLESPTIDR